jgi:hypothetical protein
VAAMNKDLLNILTNSNKDIDNQRLMDYLAGKLTEQENNEIEQLLAENEFMNDAAEGLAAVKNKPQLNSLVEQLNADLRKKLDHKKQRKEKRRLKEYPVVYIAIIVVLLLIILAWWVLQKLPSGH